MGKATGAAAAAPSARTSTRLAASPSARQSIHDAEPAAPGSAPKPARAPGEATLGCKEDPVHAQARFCRTHLALETTCAAFVDPPAGAPVGTTGSFCTAPVVPGKRCCVDPAHAALEAEYGGAGSRRTRKRQDGESTAEWRAAEAAW
jgi:hypothetical protein